MRKEVTYTPYATSSKEQTGNIITFKNFEEGNLVSETCNDAENGDKSDDNSIMPSVGDSDYEHMFTEMLKDICDGNQSHPNFNKIESRYNIRDCIKQKQFEWKRALKDAQNIGKGLQKLVHKLPISFQNPEILLKLQHCQMTKINLD